VAAWAALRLPTGDSGGASLATVSGLGLGAWEPAVGAELRWSISTPVTLIALSEVGVRVAPIGPVQPGVRWMTGAAIAHQVTARWGWTAAVTEIIETEARESGQAVADSGTRRTLVSVGASAFWGESWRTLLSLGGDVPLPGVERNIATQFRVGMALIWSR
jgi:hypothetical protein